jgi:chromosome segregation ATPase
MSFKESIVSITGSLRACESTLVGLTAAMADLTTRVQDMSVQLSSVERQVKELTDTAEETRQKVRQFNQADAATKKLLEQYRKIREYHVQSRHPTDASWAPIKFSESHTVASFTESKGPAAGAPL